MLLIQTYTLFQNKMLLRQNQTKRYYANNTLFQNKILLGRDTS